VTETCVRRAKAIKQSLIVWGSMGPIFPLPYLFGKHGYKFTFSPIWAIMCPLCPVLPSVLEAHSQFLTSLGSSVSSACKACTQYIRFLTCLEYMGPISPDNRDLCVAIHTHTCMRLQGQCRNPHFYKGLWHNHPHLSHSLLLYSQEGTHKSMHSNGPCTCRHADRGWTHTHRCPVHTVCLKTKQSFIMPITRTIILTLNSLSGKRTHHHSLEDNGI